MRSEIQLEQCPDCRVMLPKNDHDISSHRYIGASSSCWTLFGNLVNAGEPPLAPGRLNPLIIDAYAAQHHGTSSPQAIQSVAVHLLVLYGVLNQNVSPKNALWIRRRALRMTSKAKQSRYQWLAPPDFTGCVTAADISQAPTPEGRAEKAVEYVEQVWTLWAQQHLSTLARWYEKYVIPDIIPE